jgi:hypothetical protein
MRAFRTGHSRHCHPVFQEEDFAMKPILLAAAMAVLAVPALAQGSVSTQPLVEVPNVDVTPLISCWYNPNGIMTGSDTAAAGVEPGGPVRTSQTGDYTWRYTIRAENGTRCPRQKPN